MPNGVSARAANASTPARSADSVAGEVRPGTAHGSETTTRPPTTAAAAAPPGHGAARPQARSGGTTSTRAARPTRRRPPRRRARGTGVRAGARLAAVQRQRRRRHPRQRGVADQHRPLALPQPLGQVGVPGEQRRGGDRRDDAIRCAPPAGPSAAPRPNRRSAMIATRIRSWTTSPGSTREASATNRSLGTARGTVSTPSRWASSGSRGHEHHVAGQHVAAAEDRPELHQRSDRRRRPSRPRRRSTDASELGRSLRATVHVVLD